MRGVLPIVVLAGALSACGSPEERTAPPPAAKGMALQDLSKVSAAVYKDAGGIKADAAVLRTRRIVGRWSGMSDATRVNVVFGSDGTSTIEALRADGAMIAGGSGRYAWQPDGTLKGTFSGLSGTLAGFASWSGGFPTTSSMLLSGSGVTASLSKGGM